MSTNHAWSDAYFAQAQADLKGARAVGGIAPSVFAMLLQMVFEKLGKAALLRTGEITIDKARKTHRAAISLVQAMRRQRHILTPVINLSVWEDVLWVIPELENAQPALARKRTEAQGGVQPQLEYPWELPTGAVNWPAEHLSIARSLGNPESHLGIRALQFADHLVQRFYRIFP